MTKKEVTKLLLAGVCEVTFRKVVSGELRQMQCTLQPELLPEPKKDAKKHRKENPDVVSAWDTEKKDWRSFRVDHVIAVVHSYPL